MEEGPKPVEFVPQQYQAAVKSDNPSWGSTLWVERQSLLDGYTAAAVQEGATPYVFAAMFLCATLLRVLIIMARLKPHHIYTTPLKALFD